ncbi:hypothetical protein [Roseimarinus sediminis]|uniref:hypothetical protein n=1 Tax=Roseimarinus sediminis TaxID=1610899 RepID=UPI003D1E386E
MEKVRTSLISIFFFISATSLHAQQDYRVASEIILRSDGPEGIDTYTLIQSKFGSGCIEAPDLYSVNHPGEKHIVETSDDEVGNYFLFKIHKKEDRDRDTDKTDRQRNEIKTFDNSPNEGKGFKGQSMRFHWYFKLKEGYAISKNFSHFFQLKAKGGDDSQPIVTISGSINNNQPEFEIIYNSGNSTPDRQIASAPWGEANSGKWMEMEVLATFADEGYLKITVRDLYGKLIMETEKEAIDLWRTGSTFVRPKWGIYRSLSSASYLRDEEETAGFAHFTLQKIEWKQTNLAEQSMQNESFSISPVPSESKLFIHMATPQSGLLEIINARGQSCFRKTMDRRETETAVFLELPPGCYLVKFNQQVKKMYWK